MRYRLRTLLILGMIASAALAASARLLESAWFEDLTGWHGKGGHVVETFSREVSARLLWLPLIFAAADIYVACCIPAQKRNRGFWAFATIAYASAFWLCNQAICYSRSPLVSDSHVPFNDSRHAVADGRCRVIRNRSSPTYALGWFVVIRYRLRTLLVLLALVPPLFGLVVVSLLRVSDTPRKKESESAMLTMKHYAYCRCGFAEQSQGRTFAMTNASAQQIREFTFNLGFLRRHGLPLLPHSEFAVSTLPCRADEIDPTRIVIVWTRPFNNSRQSGVGNCDLTHMVAYEDGSIGFLSPSEFATLDKSSFVPLSVITGQP